MALLKKKKQFFFLLITSFFFEHTPIALHDKVLFILQNKSAKMSTMQSTTSARCL